MGEIVKRLPWEPAPLEDTVAALQRDFAYAIAYTAVTVRSSQAALRRTVNTPRGQVIPRGECLFTDGSTIELLDLGMPQIGVETMAVSDLMAWVWETAKNIGLELK